MISEAQPRTAEPDLIAIVDDDDAARDALEFLLTVLGRNARSFASASAFLDDGGGRYACLLLDQHMPVMTGLELAAQLRSARNSIPIMLISGNLTVEVRERAALIGIDMVCDKPPQPDSIARFVDHAIEHRTAI